MIAINHRQSIWHCQSIWLLRLALCLLICFSFSLCVEAQSRWKAGAAKINITPQEPIWLSGYAARTKPSSGVLADIYVKALALEDEQGRVSVIVTSDLLGFNRAMVDEIAGRVKKEYGVAQDRLLLNASHNHSGPVTSGMLHLIYPLDDEQKQVIDRYTSKLLDQVVEAVGSAIKNLAPAELSFGQGLAGFAVNRRRSQPGNRHLPGPVDHDVPVLAVKSANGELKAALFGYACHATTLSGYQLSGDYPGFAQAEIERRHPGAVALFLMGCGADANPLPRLRESDAEDAIELARRYGLTLAVAVEVVLRGRMIPVTGPLEAAFERVELSLQKPPNREQLSAMLTGKEGYERRAIEHQLSLLDREGRLADRALYPIQVWQFGRSLKLVALGGETVVDYALRFKNRYGWEATWVAGYTNDVIAYIPSLRVLREGGYEGAGAMMLYGLPAPFSESVEEVIAGKVEELIRRTSLQ